MINNKKTIVFIGGTNRSGTTVLNLILANDEKAMALGELSNIFYPIYKRQVKIAKEIKADPLWKPIFKDGPKEVYTKLIQAFPDIDYFIDSSKDPLWIERQTNYNKECEIKNVLIFKHPEKLKQSFL